MSTLGGNAISFQEFLNYHIQPIFILGKFENANEHYFTYRKIKEGSPGGADVQICYDFSCFLKFTL